MIFYSEHCRYFYCLVKSFRRLGSLLPSFITGCVWKILPQSLRVFWLLFSNTSPLLLISAVVIRSDLDVARELLGTLGVVIMWLFLAD